MDKSKYDNLWSLLAEIERGQHDRPSLVQKMGWPETSVKYRMAQLSVMGVIFERVGGRRHGYYNIVHWGPIDKGYVTKFY